MVEVLAERFNYAVIIILMMVGLYAVIATGNLVKRLVGLSIFQTSVFLLYISMSKVFGGARPSSITRRWRMTSLIPTRSTPTRCPMC